MRVTDIFVRNFRGIENLSLYFSSAQTTIMVGIDGSCKSTILECLALLLSYSTLSLQQRPSKAVSADDIRVGQTECSIEMTTTFGRRDYTTSLHITPDDWNFESSNLDAAMETTIDIDPRRGLPIAVYYPVHRYVQDVPAATQDKHSFPTTRAYEGALTGETADFKEFFVWFRWREDIEKQERSQRPQYRDHQLQAVRRAVRMMLPTISSLRVRRAPARMVVRKSLEPGGSELEILVTQMADGEKCMMAMAGDLARRLAIANPSMEDPLTGTGVVLIDEIGLHLHPAWQSTVVADLERTFPQCQFIITTHSPHVLTHMKSRSIYLLKPSPEGVMAQRPMGALGTGVHRVLEELAGAPDPFHAIVEELRLYLQAIDEGNADLAHASREKLDHFIEVHDKDVAVAEGRPMRPAKSTGGSE